MKEGMMRKDNLAMKGLDHTADLPFDDVFMMKGLKGRENVLVHQTGISLLNFPFLTIN